MTAEHVHRILTAGRWCYRYNRDYVKQTIRSKKGVKGAGTRSTESMTIVGESLDASYAVFHHLLRLGNQVGWHLKDGIAIQVAKHARSFRSPAPRFEPTDFPLRSSFGRFVSPGGQAEWRRLESRVAYLELANKQALIGDIPEVLVIFFHALSSANKEREPAENCTACQGQ